MRQWTMPSSRSPLLRRPGRRGTSEKLPNPGRGTLKYLPIRILFHSAGVLPALRKLASLRRSRESHFFGKLRRKRSLESKFPRELHESRRGGLYDFAEKG